MSDQISSISSEVRDGAAIITIDRPEFRNAMTIRMMADFNQAVARAESDPRVLAIIVTGSGSAFCSGIDIAAVREMSESGDRRLEERGMSPERPAQFANLRSVDKPVIAAINGVAAGVGLVLALMCDVRIMDEAAAITTSFAKLGLLAEHGTSWLLPRLVGTGKALDLLWTSRRVPAAEALEMGLVDRVAAPGTSVDQALAFVDAMRGSSPHSLARMKQMVLAHLDRGFDEALRDADRTVNEWIGHPDVAEGLAAIRDKRAPRFQSWPSRR
jgi:enoyl-CoA hydratase/carnithine racemase